MSKLTNIPFNENGPVIVPQETFDAYQANHQLYGNFYNSSKIWLEHTDDDGILRLCIRDILRQNYLDSCGHHLMRSSYANLLHNDHFYAALSESEEMRDEFVEETLYNIRNRLLPLPTVDNSADDNLAEIIELLLVLERDFHIEKIDVEKIWALHPVHQPCDAPFEQAWKQLEFCIHGMCSQIKNAKNVPRFYEETWNLLKNTITQCINVCREDLEKRNNVYSEQYPNNPRSWPISAPDNAEEMLVDFCKEIHYGSRITKDAIYLLEAELPTGVRYLSWDQLQKILPALARTGYPQDELACRCLQRHIHTAYNRELYKLDHKFLNWAIGLTSRGHNLDGGKAVSRLAKILPPFK